MPANSLGVHIDPQWWNGNDGFRPGSTIVVKVPGLDNAAAYAQSKPFASQPAAPQPGLATRPSWSSTRPRASGRPSGPSSTPTPPSRRGAQPRDPPGGQLPRGPPLHRRPAQPATRPTAADPGAARLPHLPRRPALEQPAIERAAPHLRAIFADAEDAGDRAPSLYLAWDFTVASDENITGRSSRSATTPSPSSATTTSPTAGRRATSPQFTVDERRTRPARRQIAPPRQGHVRRALLPVPGCAPGGTFSSTPTASRSRTGNVDRRPTSTASSRARRGPGRRRRRVPRSTATACSAAPARSHRVAQRTCRRPRHRVLRDRLDRHVATSDVADRPRALQRPVALPKLADRLQQGLLDELFLGRAMISPSGFTPTPRSTRTAARRLGDRHHAPLLQRQQPGRHHGRRADRASPGLHRAALGVPAMNYSVLLPRSVDFDDPIDPRVRRAGPLRPRRPSTTGGYPDTAEPADPRPHAAAVGPRRAAGYAQP